MLTGVIKQKDVVEIDRPISINGIKGDLSQNQILISVNDSGDIFLNNDEIKIQNLDASINLLEGKIIIDIDKNTSIYDFNKVLEKIKKVNKKEVFVKVKDKANDR
jgi:biopolymer transport protein ExbD